MNDEEYQRERNRLKQVRLRKHKRALAEGKPDDFYITDEDYIGRGDLNQGAAMRGATMALASERPRVTKTPTKRAQDDNPPAPEPFWVTLLKGAAFVGICVIAGIAGAQGNIPNQGS